MAGWTTTGTCRHVIGDPAGEYGQRIRQTVDFVQQRAVEKVADHIHAGRHSSVLFCDAAVNSCAPRMHGPVLRLGLLHGPA